MVLQAIKPSPTTLQSLLQESSIGVAVVDEHGDVINANQAYTRLLGECATRLKPHSKAALTAALSQPTPAALTLKAFDDSTIVVQLDQLQSGVRMVTANARPKARLLSTARPSTPFASPRSLSEQADSESIQAQERAASEQLELELAIGRALWRKELSIRYQPLVDLRQHRVYGFEALLRWHNGVVGSISPERFIPLAEKTGAILSIGEWVLREACMRVQDTDPALSLSVNISPVQLDTDGFSQFVDDALSRTGLAAERLSLEIPEAILVQGSRRALDHLRRVRKLGVKIAIDNFGSGYASLIHLPKLPVDILKIDRSLLLEKQDTRSQTLVHCIVDLGNNLGLQCVAKGVEKPDQYQRLCRIGCDAAQGFLLGRPLPVEQLRGYLSSASDRLRQLC